MVATRKKTPTPIDRYQKKTCSEGGFLSVEGIITPSSTSLEKRGKGSLPGKRKKGKGDARLWKSPTSLTAASPTEKGGERGNQVEGIYRSSVRLVVSGVRSLRHDWAEKKKRGFGSKKKVEGNPPKKEPPPKKKNLRYSFLFLALLWGRKDPFGKKGKKKSPTSPPKVSSSTKGTLKRKTQS